MTVPAVITTPRTRVLIDWLVSAGWDITQETGYPLFPGPEILPSPDRAVFLTPTPGPGYTTEEGGTDAWGFQARLRGPSDQPDAAQAGMQLLDWTILGGPRGVTSCGVDVRNVQRLGSTPSPLPLDPSDRRTEYTCDYIITTGA
jgi:hypothetical protein